MLNIKEPITLDEAKSFLRIEHDFDNAYITSLIVLARTFVEEYQSRLIAARTASDPDEIVPSSETPTALEKQAILLLIAHFYEERQAVTTTSMIEMPLGVKALLYFNRNLEA